MDEMPRKTAAELEAECLLPSEGLGHHPDDERKLRTSHPERTGREARPTRRRVSQTRKTRRSRKGRFDRTDGPRTQPRIQDFPKAASSAFGGPELRGTGAN
jgi:hypothetical protein